MALEQKCPGCSTFQKVANKKCSCGYSLETGKKRERVPIYLRMRGGRRKSWR